MFKKTCDSYGAKLDCNPRQNSAEIVSAANNRAAFLERLFAGILLSVIPAIGADAATAEVHVRGVTIGTGEVRANLCLESEFVKKPCTLRAHVSAKLGETIVVFTGVAPGQYAVSLYHDVNGNGTLDTDFIGRPTEPYGFSHDVEAAFGAPSFKDAAIDVSEPRTQVVVNLQH